jgi:hypothetical protein
MEKLMEHGKTTDHHSMMQTDGKTAPKGASELRGAESPGVLG